MTAPPDSRVWSGRRAIVPFLRWASAAAVVLAVHVGGAWVLVHRITALTEPPGIPAAILIDLAPLPVSSEAPAPDVAPGPPLRRLRRKRTQTHRKTCRRSRSRTRRQRAPIRLSMSRSFQKRKRCYHHRGRLTLRDSRKKPATRKPPVERKRPEVSNRLEQTRNSAPPAAQARPVEAAASPSLGNASSSGSVQSWRGALVAHLNRQNGSPAAPRPKEPRRSSSRSAARARSSRCAWSGRPGIVSSIRNPSRSSIGRAPFRRRRRISQEETGRSHSPFPSGSIANGMVARCQNLAQVALRSRRTASC